jgi:ABC-2 type transport system permease protein
MSVATQTAPPGHYRQTAPQGHYRLKQVAKSEMAKILTLPSTAITLGLTLVAGLLVTGLVTNSALHHSADWYQGFDPTQSALTGMLVAGLTGGVFGALLISAEYSSGTIRATLAATPRRPLLLAAKIGVALAATVIFFELLSFVSFFLGQAILSGGGAPSASLGSPGALRAVLMTGLFISLLGLMSFGFGLICRSTAAAIAAFVGVVFVLPLVMQGISGPALRYVPTYILTNSIMATVNHGPVGPGGTQPMASATGLLLMAAYAAITLAAGALLFLKRDA